MNFRKSPRGKPNSSQHGFVKAGWLLPWHHCQTADLSQCSWERSVLLGMTVALHLPGIVQYQTKGESTLNG